MKALLALAAFLAMTSAVDKMPSLHPYYKDTPGDGGPSRRFAHSSAGVYADSNHPRRLAPRYDYQGLYGYGRRNRYGHNVHPRDGLTDGKVYKMEGEKHSQRFGRNGYGTYDFPY